MIAVVWRMEQWHSSSQILQVSKIMTEMTWTDKGIFYFVFWKLILPKEVLMFYFQIKDEKIDQNCNISDTRVFSSLVCFSPFGVVFDLDI